VKYVAYILCELLYNKHVTQARYSDTKLNHKGERWPR
jgi:hypothetical protein